MDDPKFVEVLTGDWWRRDLPNGDFEVVPYTRLQRVPPPPLPTPPQKAEA